VAPPGITNTTVPESMCYTVLRERDPATGISIRSYSSADEQVVSTCGNVPYDLSLMCIQEALAFFSGANSMNRSLLPARTMPAIIGGFFAGTGYYVLEAYVTVSSSVFPNASAIPRPTRARLQPVGKRTVAVVQFNTTGAPTAQDFQLACYSININTLPQGYGLNMDSDWYPAHIYYNGADATNFTNECWMAIYPPL